MWHVGDRPAYAGPPVWPSAYLECRYPIQQTGLFAIGIDTLSNNVANAAFTDH